MFMFRAQKEAQRGFRTAISSKVCTKENYKLAIRQRKTTEAGE